MTQYAQESNQKVKKLRNFLNFSLVSTYEDDGG
jgi:hypothetical protein